MRTARTFGAVFGVLVLAATARAQETPQQMTVSVPEVEVRSGPSAQFYPTAKLALGATVEPVPGKEKEGWLAIKPPPGSFGWINARFIKQLNANTGVVVA